MAFVWDNIYGVNLILCIIIVVMSYLAYKKAREYTPLYIGAAFGLFGISHLAILFGLRDSLGNVLVAVRLLAYIIVVFALYRIAFRK